VEVKMARSLILGALLTATLGAWLTAMLLDDLRPDAQALVSLHDRRLACADAILTATPQLDRICGVRNLAYGVPRPEQVAPATGVDAGLAKGS
jgi:hypothetical protein